MTRNYAEKMRNNVSSVIAMGLAALTVVSANAEPNKQTETFLVGEKHAYITILSYNVKGLPAFAGVTDDRYADIGKELKKLREQKRQPAIVLLQEAFVGKTKDIEKNSGYANVARGPSSVEFNGGILPAIKPLGGGLKILSDFPITKKSKVTYGALTCSSWDCLANKGAQAAEIAVPGIPFPIVVANTHTQAGRGHDQVRIKQLNALQKFIGKFAPDHEPLFAIGDFNTWPSLSCYKHWMKETKMASVSDRCLDGSLECLVTLRNNRGLDFNPDHHFFRSGRINGYDVSIRPVHAEHLFFQPVNGRLLSDHWGYNVTYEIKWEQVNALASSSN